MAASHKGDSGYFGKEGHGKYRGPSGKTFDLAQVKLFYSRGGKFPGQKPKSVRSGWREAAHQRGVHHSTYGKSL